MLGFYSVKVRDWIVLNDQIKVAIQFKSGRVQRLRLKPRAERRLLDLGR